MEWITDPQALIALLTLTMLEIVLGIDNIVFISILSSTISSIANAKSSTPSIATGFQFQIDGTIRNETIR